MNDLPGGILFTKNQVQTFLKSVGPGSGCCVSQHMGTAIFFPE
jgi:hypothetical protein